MFCYGIKIHFGLLPMGTQIVYLVYCCPDLIPLCLYLCSLVYNVNWPWLHIIKLIKLFPNSFLTSDWFWFVTFIMSLLSYECYKTKPVSCKIWVFISLTICDQQFKSLLHWLIVWYQWKSDIQKLVIICSVNKPYWSWQC